MGQGYEYGEGKSGRLTRMLQLLKHTWTLNVELAHSSHHFTLRAASLCLLLLYYCFVDATNFTTIPHHKVTTEEVVQEGIV